MNPIPVYKAEASDGLKDQIIANASISYASELKRYTPERNVLDTVKSSLSGLNPSLAGLHDKDLYFVKSLFCSSNWNLNDDVFDVKELWASRHTPSHKPTNIDHDENKIVGHMASVWAIDDDGNVLSDDINNDDLPDLIHLIVASVIYQQWESPDLKTMATELVEKIESGDKFVSMECMFTDFDYAIQVSSGEWKTTARNEETAFLTKHLRCYGGTGEYEGQRIGRILRNLTYVGKGYVDKPANPGSIIFNENSPFSFGSQSKKTEQIILDGVSFSNENTKFSDDFLGEHKMTEHLEKDNQELKTQNDSLRAEIAALKDDFNEEGKTKLQSMIDNLKSDLEIKFDEAEAKDKEIKSLTTANDDTKTEVENLNKANDDLAKQLEDNKVDILKADRIASLVDVGVDKVEAEQIVETFSGINDEQFLAVVSREKALIEALSSHVDTDTDTDTDVDTDTDTTDDDDDVSANLDTSTLDDVDVTNDDLTGVATTVVDETTDAHAGLVDLVSASLGYNSDNDKGEK